MQSRMNLGALVERTSQLAIRDSPSWLGKEERSTKSMLQRQQQKLASEQRRS
jgi:hypothetical protein